MEVVTADDAPSGKRYVRFHNAEPGRGAQALQAFAVDGRYVRQLEFLAPRPLSQRQAGPRGRRQRRCWKCSSTMRTAPRSATRRSGPLRGSSDWKTEAKKIDVPVRAREAIMRIGLFGATGELSLDDVQMKGLP